MTRIALLSTFFVVLVLAGCEWFVQPEPEPGDALVRVLHGAADASSVDVLVDGEAALQGVAFKQGSGYLEVEEGERNVQVTVAGDAEAIVIDLDLELVADAAYTILALGEVAAESENPPAALLLVDDTAAPAAGNVKVRVVHGAPNAPNVDVYVTDVEGTLDEPTLADVTFRDASGTLEVAAGAYRIILTVAGDADAVAYDSGTVNLAAGAMLTIVALENTAEDGASPVTLVALTGDATTPVIEIPDFREPTDNDTITDATPVAAGTTWAVIDPAGDIDFYRLTLHEGALVQLAVRAEAIGSPLDSFLVLHLDDGTPIGFNDDADLDTLDSALGFYLPAGTYVITVEDVFGDGGPDFVYALDIALEPIEDVVFEATAGTFAGNSNAPTIGAFEGNVVAISARDTAYDALEYPVLLQVTDPAFGSYPFVFDPWVDGVVYVVTGDWSGYVSTSTAADHLAGFSKGATPDAPTGSLHVRPAPSGISPSAAIGGTFTFVFPNVTFARTVDADGALTVPTVTGAANEGTSVTVSFAEPEGAAVYNAKVFSRWTGATASATGSESPIVVTMPAALGAGERFVVDLLAGDALYTLPLPDAPIHVSAYLYYGTAD